MPVAAASPTGVADGSEAHDGGRGDGGGSAGNRRRRMYDGTYVRTAAYGGIQDRSSSIGEKTRVTDSPRITSGKRFFFQASHFIRRLEVLRSNLSILIPKYLAYLLSQWGQIRYLVFSFNL